MHINPKLVKHYLSNVMFINGTSYAGKSTMCQMLADRYGLIHCEENYDCIPEGIVTAEEYPNLGYMQTVRSSGDWRGFVSRSPEEYGAWIIGSSRELVEFELTYLMHNARRGRLIVDTNLPADVLHQIADYNQVAIMLTTPEISRAHFFERDDDKPWFLEQIQKLEDPAWGLENFTSCMAHINSQEAFDAWMNSGFFTLVRQDVVSDTKEQTLQTLAKHFGLT